MPWLRFNHLEILGFKRGDLKRPKIEKETSQEEDKMAPQAPPEALGRRTERAIETETIEPRIPLFIVKTGQTREELLDPFKENYEIPLAEQVDVLRAEVEKLRAMNLWQLLLWWFRGRKKTSLGHPALPEHVEKPPERIEMSEEKKDEVIDFVEWLSDEVEKIVLISKYTSTEWLYPDKSIDLYVCVSETGCSLAYTGQCDYKGDSYSRFERRRWVCQELVRKEIDPDEFMKTVRQNFEALKEKLEETVGMMV